MDPHVHVVLLGFFFRRGMPSSCVLCVQIGATRHLLSVAQPVMHVPVDPPRVVQLL